MSEATATKDIPAEIQRQMAQTVVTLSDRARLSPKGVYGLEVAVALANTYKSGRATAINEVLALIADFKRGTVSRSKGDRAEVAAIQGTLSVLEAEVSSLRGEA
jgi:hypothetical protein